MVMHPDTHEIMVLYCILVACSFIMCYSLCCNAALQTADGEDDLKKGTQLLEIYALEIQMYTAQKNNKKLKVWYYEHLFRALESIILSAAF